MQTNINKMRRYLILSWLILASIVLQFESVIAADRVNTPDIDWASNGKVDFCASSNAFDFRNAYWMGALSYYSYWHLKYIDKLYKSQPGTPVEINFEHNDKKAESDVVPVTSIFKGLGFGTLRSTYFSSSILKPESGHKYPNLVRRWFPPLPGEACIKSEMYFCFGAAVSNSHPNPDIVARCGERNEKSLMEVKRLQRIQDFSNGKKFSKEDELEIRRDKKHIEGLVKKYEDQKHVNVGLNWQDENVVQRCEQYKFKDDLIPDTQGAIYENADAITIVFRGTEEGNTTDIMTDLFGATKVDLSKNSKSKGSVHEGFYKASHILRDWVLREIEEIRKLRPESVSKPIFITGHSLGGALANLVMYNLLEYNERSKNKEGFQGLNLKSLYTFGSPRVGDEIWAGRFKLLADKMKVGLFRVVNFNDIVPRVPCIDYVHVGTLVYLENGKLVEGLMNQLVNVLINPVDSPMSEASLHSGYNACGYNSALTHPLGIPSMIQDHFMASYYTDLAKLRSVLNEKFKSEEVKANLSGNSSAVSELQYPLNCNANASTSNLEGVLKLNYQMFNSEVETMDSIF
jgi:predicted lipase